MVHHQYENKIQKKKRFMISVFLYSTLNDVVKFFHRLSSAPLINKIQRKKRFTIFYFLLSNYYPREIPLLEIVRQMVPIIDMKNEIEKNSWYPVLYSSSNDVKVFNWLSINSIDKQNPKEKGIRDIPILYFPIIIHVKFPYWK